MHGEVNAGGEDRVYERIGIADQQPARSAEPVAGIRIVAGGVQVADDLRLFHASANIRNAMQGLDEEVAVRSLSLLQVIRAAHRAHAHEAVAQGIIQIQP